MFPATNYSLLEASFSWLFGSYDLVETPSLETLVSFLDQHSIFSLICTGISFSSLILGTGASQELVFSFLLLSVVHQLLSRLVLLNVFTVTLPVKSINQHLLCGVSTCTPLTCFPLWMLWNPGILQPPQLYRYVGSTLISVLSFILFF